MQGNGPIEFGAHGRTRTAGLLLTKEVLVDQFPEGAPLRSDAAATTINRCLAALPIFSHDRHKNCGAHCKSDRGRAAIPHCHREVLALNNGWLERIGFSERTFCLGLAQYRNFH